MLIRFGRGFQYAFTGLRLAWTRGINFKVQVVCAFLILALGWSLHLSPIEFSIIIFCIVLVLATETVNTALEELCDTLQPSHDPHIARIKDLSAAAVLVTCIGAAVIGIIIFTPHLW